MNTTRRDIFNSLIGAAISMAALLIAWPFANLPFNDDWTWAFTVLQLSKTGHLIYNGWSSPPVIAQAYWGLLWVKLFGFSFNVLRISSMPMAVGAVGICYLLNRRAGLTAALSVFIALLMGLSPWYMPLEATFMTDVPGLFFMLLSMYALTRGFQSQPRRAAVGWLMFGAISALVGGSSRQVVWIVPLVVMPYFAFLRRADRTFVVATTMGWLIVFCGAVFMQHWFARQPYALPDPPIMSYWYSALHHPRDFVVGVICIVLTLVLMILPAAGGLLRLKPGMRELITGVLCAAAPWAGWLIHHRRPRFHWVNLLVPWLGNIFTSQGVLNMIEIAGGRPTVIPLWVRVALSLSVLAAMSLLISSAILWILHNRRQSSNRLLAFFLKSKTDRAAIPAMVLVSLALFALEMTRSISGVSYDRHLVPLIPFAAAPLLMAYQLTGRTRMPIASWILLAMYTGYGIASTQEINSLARARVIAIQKLENASIAANQIEAGFEFNRWTDVEIEGHVNDPRIRNPGGAYDKNKGPLPALHVVYRLESDPTIVTVTTPYGTVDYFSLLPPFHRKVYIDRFKDAWWLDPTKAATRPVEKSTLPSALLDQYNYK